MIGKKPRSSSPLHFNGRRSTAAGHSTMTLTGSSCSQPTRWHCKMTKHCGTAGHVIMCAYEASQRHAKHRRYRLTERRCTPMPARHAFRQHRMSKPRQNTCANWLQPEAASYAAQRNICYIPPLRKPNPPFSCHCCSQLLQLSSGQTSVKLWSNFSL